MLKKIQSYKKTTTVNIERIKEIVTNKSRELKESLDLVVEDPSLSINSKVNIIINSTSLACAIVAIQPLPFADIFILSPIQVVMVIYLGKVLGMNTSKKSASEIITYLLATLGWGMLSQQVVIGLYKTVIPYAGGFTTIPLVYASTFSLGMASKALIMAKVDNIKISKEELKKIRQETINKIKKEDRDWSPEIIKNQFTGIYRKEFKIYKDKLNEYDGVINNNNKFSISDINYKKKHLSERLSIYPNVKVNDKVLYTIAFMNSEKTISYIENTLAKLDRKEIKLEPKFSKSVYSINGLCELYIYSNKGEYLIEDIIILDKDVDDIISAFSSKNEVYHLKNEQIREKFIYSIESALYELNISSPWMNNYVVDENLINKMEEALSRGVSIKITYGISNNSYDSRGNARSEKSDNVALKLCNRFSHFRDKFKIKKINSHYKLLICDEKFFIEGSFNFLSFSGEYKEDIRSEGATYSTDLKMIRELRDMYFSF